MLCLCRLPLDYKVSETLTDDRSCTAVPGKLHKNNNECHVGSVVSEVCNQVALGKNHGSLSPSVDAVS
jgi:hypothetical protein